MPTKFAQQYIGVPSVTISARGYIDVCDRSGNDAELEIFYEADGDDIQWTGVFANGVYIGDLLITGDRVKDSATNHLMAQAVRAALRAEQMQAEEDRAADRWWEWAA